jgi:hypothetical protein
MILVALVLTAEAMHYYSLIDAKSCCYKDAQKEYNEYVSKLNPVAKRDWNQKLVEYKDEIELVKQGKLFEMEEKKMAFEYQTKIKEIESKTEIEGNKRLLAKYKHDESALAYTFIFIRIQAVKGRNEYFKLVM